MALQMWCLKDVQLTQEYLGSDIKWTDSSDGKSSARRVTKKYLVTCACPKCGSQ